MAANIAAGAKAITQSHRGVRVSIAENSVVSGLGIVAFNLHGVRRGLEASTDHLEGKVYRLAGNGVDDADIASDTQIRLVFR